MAERLEGGGVAGLRIVTFESRRRAELAEMLRRRGAEVLEAPSMRELPLEENQAAAAFVAQLDPNALDLLILQTGVGTTALIELSARVADQRVFLQQLSRIPILARGPKPVAALRPHGISPTYRAPEPNTWREILAELERVVDVAGKRIAVQEYGAPSVALVAALRDRGALVQTIPVYRWDLPDDLEPLAAALAEIIGRRVDVCVFTAAAQIDHVFRVAAQRGWSRDELCAAWAGGVLVAAVGPVTAEALAERGVAVDLTASPPKLGPLVALLDERSGELVRSKRRRLD